MPSSSTYCSTPIRGSHRRLTHIPAEFQLSLQAVAHRITQPMSSLAPLLDTLPLSRQLDVEAGLDELNQLTRTRAGYSFAELCFDLQHAVLSLIASRDLVSPTFDLARWLDDLRHDAAMLGYADEVEAEAA